MTQAQIIRDNVSTMRDIGRHLAEISPSGFRGTQQFAQIRELGRMLQSRADDAERAAIEARRTSESVN